MLQSASLIIQLADTRYLNGVDGGNPLGVWLLSRRISVLIEWLEKRNVGAVAAAADTLERSRAAVG